MSLQRNHIVVLLTLSIAFMLDLIILPDSINWMRPDWLTLILIYWTMALPRQVGVFHAFIFGLLMDVSHGALLGQHALSLVLIIYVIHSVHLRLRVFSLMQQMLTLLPLLLIQKIMIFWVYGITEQLPPASTFFIPAITSTLLWPWVFITLRDLRRRFCKADL